MTLSTLGYPITCKGCGKDMLVQHTRYECPILNPDWAHELNDFVIIPELTECNTPDDDCMKFYCANEECQFFMQGHPTM